MDDFEYHGKWWLPTAPAKSVGGVLSFDRQLGGHLKLFEPIIDPVDEEGRYTPQTIDTIHGKVREGKDLTLRNCRVQVEGETIGKAIRQICTPELILSGAQFENDIYFDYISLNLPHLEEWTQVRTIIPQVTLNNGDSIGRYESLDPICCRLSDVEIVLDTTTSWKNNGTKGSEYIQNSTIEIHPRDNYCLEDLRPFISRINEYFSFATDDVIHPKSILGIIEREEEVPPHKTDIYYRQPQYSAPRTDKRSFSFNFTLDDIDFQESLQSWFDSLGPFETFHDLYFSVLFEEKPHVRYSFLTLIIALESYFNNTVDDVKLMDKDEYSTVWKEAVNEIPDDIPAKDRIQNLLRSGIGNEPSLREKLEYLAREHEEVVSDLIDIETTMKEARDTRHALAHGLSKSDRGSYARLEPRELSTLTRKLQLLVEIRLFYAAAVDETVTQEQLMDKYDIF